MVGQMRERLWVLRLIAGHAIQRMALNLSGAASSLLPPVAHRRVTEWAFSLVAPSLQPCLYHRALRALQARGMRAAAARKAAARYLAWDWLRQVRLRTCRKQSLAALRHHMRAIQWHDPQGLWAAAAGRQRVICFLPSGDLELAIAAVLDRPGAPTHYFLKSPHAEHSAEHAVLRNLQRHGRLLEIGGAKHRGQAWRSLRRGATVICILHPADLAASVPEREAGPVRLAKLAGVPMLLLGHRYDSSDAGTLHVLGEFGGKSATLSAQCLRESAHSFIAAAPLDWHHLDR